MVYLNGQLHPRAEARIDPTDRGLLLGDGLFETMRADRGRIFRLTLTRGPGPRGLLPPPDPRPTLLITASHLPSTPHPPATAHIASIRRNEHSPLSNIKSLNYLDNLIARQEALAHGADEALLLNTAGHLAEASSANLFVVTDGILHTPSLTDGALPGITRAVVLEVAAELGLPAAETSLTPLDLARADEAFLTNSLMGIRALVKVRGQPVGRGEAGPITRQVQERYEAPHELPKA